MEFFLCAVYACTGVKHRCRKRLRDPSHLSREAWRFPKEIQRDLDQHESGILDVPLAADLYARASLHNRQIICQNLIWRAHIEAGLNVIVALSLVNRKLAAAIRQAVHL